MEDELLLIQQWQQELSAVETAADLLDPSHRQAERELALALARVAEAEAHVAELAPISQTALERAEEVHNIKRQRAALAAGRTSLVPRGEDSVKGALRNWVIGSAW